MANFNIDEEIQKILLQKQISEKTDAIIRITKESPDGEIQELELKILAVADSTFFKGIKLYAYGLESTTIIGWSNLQLEDLVAESPTLIPMSEESLRDKFNIPAEFVSGFKEALGCLSHGYYNASLAMSRRLLEKVLLCKGANKQNTLCAMINDLIERRIIDKNLRFLCDNIKLLGNSAVHANIEDASPQDAKAALDFIDFLITWLYGDIKRVN